MVGRIECHLSSRGSRRYRRHHRHRTVPRDTDRRGRDGDVHDGNIGRGKHRAAERGLYLAGADSVAGHGYRRGGPPPGGVVTISPTAPAGFTATTLKVTWFTTDAGAIVTVGEVE